MAAWLLTTHQRLQAAFLLPCLMLHVHKQDLLSGMLHLHANSKVNLLCNSLIDKMQRH